MKAQSRLLLWPSFVLIGLLGNGCAPPAEGPPPPPPGPPPPELYIGDDDAQGEADPAPPPTAPEPRQAPGTPPPPTAPPTAAAPLGAPGPSAPGPSPAPERPVAASPQRPTPLAAPAPPPPQPAPVEPAPPNEGQWIYTSQYGWLWLPYSQQYTYVSADGGVAYEYAYYPDGGWRWVYAPWVLGWGPSPYWGRLGPRHYVWYARPWFRVGVVHRGPVYHRHWHRR